MRDKNGNIVITDEMKRDALSSLNELFDCSCSSKKYIDYSLVFAYCYYLIRNNYFSYEEIDNLIADVVGSDVNIYGLYSSGRIINNRPFYNRTTSGLENMKEIFNFINSFDVDRFPKLGEKVIQNMIASDSNVCVSVSYDMVSEHTIGKYSITDLLESISSSIDMDKRFYQDLFTTLERRGYQKEIENVKKLIKRV